MLGVWLTMPMGASRSSMSQSSVCVRRICFSRSCGRQLHLHVQLEPKHL